MTIEEKITFGETIIEKAINDWKPIHILIMVSGGHDSLTNLWVSANYLQKTGRKFSVYHGNTTIGIEETRQHVRDVCRNQRLQLLERKPPNEADHYENLIRKFGFPGPTKQSHQIMYRRLKERALAHCVTHELKSSPGKSEFVLLLSGVRQQESKIRMGYKDASARDGQSSRVWANPIFLFTEQDVKDYMAANNIPVNPVKKAICISGECLCGAFAGKEERAEIKYHFPNMELELQRLEQIARENGHPWPWGKGPTDWYKKHPPGQLSLFQPMCVGCEARNDLE